MSYAAPKGTLVEHFKRKTHYRILFAAKARESITEVARHMSQSVIHAHVASGDAEGMTVPVLCGREGIWSPLNYPVVVYVSLKDGVVCLRELSEFYGTVDGVQRFKEVTL